MEDEVDEDRVGRQNYRGKVARFRPLSPTYEMQLTSCYLGPISLNPNFKPSQAAILNLKPEAFPYAYPFRGQGDLVTVYMDQSGCTPFKSIKEEEEDDGPEDDEARFRV